jgi:hypothetical protein
MVGLKNGVIKYVPIEKAIKHNKTVKKSIVDLVKILNV